MVPLILSITKKDHTPFRDLGPLVLMVSDQQKKPINCLCRGQSNEHFNKFGFNSTSGLEDQNVESLI
jgi:hypothetical protein